MSKRIAGSRRPPLTEEVPVKLTQPRWRALTAILTSAASIMPPGIHQTMTVGLIRDIAEQVNGLEIDPIVIDEEEEDDQGTGE